MPWQWICGRCPATAFWSDTVESVRVSPRKLWRSVNLLFGREKPPASSDISVNEFSRFFTAKLMLWGNTPLERRSQPFLLSIQGHLSGPSLWSYQRCCFNHFSSTWQKLCCRSASGIGDVEIAPFVTELFNCSMSAARW